MYSWEMQRSKEIVNTEIKHILSAALFLRAQSSALLIRERWAIFLYEFLYIKWSICELLFRIQTWTLWWLLWRHGWPTVQHVQPMNHQIMERCAMLKSHAVHGKTFGLVLGSPCFSGGFYFPKRTKRHESQTRLFIWDFFFIKLFM